jgi:hypothetical protein
MVDAEELATDSNIVEISDFHKWLHCSLWTLGVSTFDNYLLTIQRWVEKINIRDSYIGHEVSKLHQSELLELYSFQVLNGFFRIEVANIDNHRPTCLYVGTYLYTWLKSLHMVEIQRLLGPKFSESIATYRFKKAMAYP